jgi:alpha-L-arabinofuranosidase
MDPTMDAKDRLTRRVFLGTAALAAGAAKPLGAQQPSLAGTVSIDSSGAGTTFDRMLFGQFLEHFHRQVYGGVFEPGSPLSSREGFRQDVVAALRELRIPVVRWPGGCFASAYHWKEGVGKSRQPSFDKAWGVEDPNTFGTDEFVKWCRAIGAEPYICTNAGTGTQEEMSDWVEYCNLRDMGRYARMRQANGFAEPHRVKFWSIGNENYLGGEIGAKTVAEWGPLVRESAKMMLAADKSIELLAAATTRGDWTAQMLKEAGRYLKYISLHGYYDPLWQQNRPSDYLSCMMRSEEAERSMVEGAALIEKAGFQGKIRIAFDEWNLRGWHHPGFPGGGAGSELIARRAENDRNETYTMADAVFSASLLHGCLRQAQHVRMACMAPVVNARGPLFVHPKGIVKRTTFHVLKMYAGLLEPDVLTSAVSSERLKSGDRAVAAFDAVATCSKDRKRFAVAVVNRHPDASVECRLRVGDAAPGGRAKMTLLAGDSPDAYNDIARADRVAPEVREWTLRNGAVQLPPHCVSIVQFEG